MAGDDLLSVFASGNSAAPSTAAVPNDDALHAWTQSVAPEVTIVAPRIRVSPPARPSAEMPQIANLEAHQGDTTTERAVRLGVGGLQGFEDVANTLARGIATTGETGANLLSSAGVLAPTTKAAVRDWAAKVRQNVLDEREAFDKAASNSQVAAVGRVGGQILATGPVLGAAEAGIGLPALAASRPVLGTALAGAATGAGANALTSAASDEPLSSQVESGALAGGILGPLGHAASTVGAGARNLLFGRISPETAQLADAAINKYGIPVTAGQIATNPLVRFADSVLQRIPFTGYGARTEAQQKGLNQAVAHEMGVSSDVVTPDVVRQAKRSAYADYDAAKASLAGPMKLDAQFYGDLHNVIQNSAYTLEGNLSNKVSGLVDNVFEKINTHNHTLDADLYQTLTRKNGPLDNAINSRDSKISTYAQSIKDALENMVGRNSPQLKKLKDEADYKYFVAKSVEPLAHEATTGDISPAKLLRALDFSETPAGEIGRIGQRFMKEPPSSGTSERMLALELLKSGLGGAVGLGGAYYFDPENFQRNALLGSSALISGALASRALRNQLLTRGMINAALGRPGSSQKVANFLTGAAPLAALTYRGASPNSLAGQ